MTAAPKKVEFAVFAPGFDPNVGGYIVLHYLCHLLNELGHTAHLIPLFSSAEISPIDSDETVRALFDQRSQIRKSPYRVNPDWNTPLYRRPLKGIAKRDDLVVVYPEIVFGNPLRAKHVARWILNNPGAMSQDIYFPSGEVHFQYLEMHRPVQVPWIEIADQMLTIVYVPWEYYQPPTDGIERKGTAYMLRKGTKKTLVHDLENSIKVDGMSHAQIGEICRRVKTFISYDTKTLYSSLAAIAGADSVVIPDEGVDEDFWQPNQALRLGLAYGWERLEWARSTRHLTAERFRQMQVDSATSAANFARFWEARLSASSQRDRAASLG